MTFIFRCFSEGIVFSAFTYLIPRASQYLLCIPQCLLHCSCIAQNAAYHRGDVGPKFLWCKHSVVLWCQTMAFAVTGYQEAQRVVACLIWQDLQYLPTHVPIWLWKEKKVNASSFTTVMLVQSEIWSSYPFWSSMCVALNRHLFLPEDHVSHTQLLSLERQVGD